LKPLEREHRVEIWDDTRIKPGSRWKEEIGQALAATNVAVLLVSADFIASDFIARDELPQLLRAAEKDGVIILPVIISPSRFEKTPSLSQFQAVNDPAEPLIGLARVKQEAILVKVSEVIDASLNQWLETRVEHVREDEAVRNVEPGREKSSLIRQLPGHAAEEIRRSIEIKEQGAQSELFLDPPTRFFTGRENVLDNLSKTLQETHLASLHGMFGIGKTSVALRYAQENKEDYSTIIFVRATETELLEKMAKAAELFDKERTDAFEKLTDKAKVLRSYLDNPENWSKKNKKYLLIFDNVDKVEQIRPYVPSNKQGHIIFTANDRNITALGNEVEISEIEVDDGELLLFRRSNSDPELSYVNISKKLHRSLKEIVMELAGSPLAINIAGAYIYSTKVSFGEYLKLIGTKESYNVILNEKDKTDRYEKTILKAFDISFSATCTADENTRESKLIAEAAKHLIEGSVFISPDDIPEELLQNYVLLQGSKFKRIVEKRDLWLKAREKAIRLDLLRYHDTKKTYWTHRLIQKSIENLLN
jgi:hypothetical protein